MALANEVHFKDMKPDLVEMPKAHGEDLSNEELIQLEQERGVREEGESEEILSTSCQFTT